MFTYASGTESCWPPKSGLYRKGVSERAKSTRKTPVLVYHLAKIFKLGIIASHSKKTAGEAIAVLRAQRVPRNIGIADGGRKMFHARSPYGRMPTEPTVKSWF